MVGEIWELREEVGELRGTGGAGSEVAHTRMMAFKSVLSRGRV